MQSTSDARYSPGLDALLRPLADLALDPDNARTHPEHNLRSISESLARFGQQKPIVVSSDGVVIAGNGTLAAAREMGWTEIACVETNLTGEEIRAYALADNRTAELAEWDVVQLAKELEQLDEALASAAGFDGDAIAKVVREAEAALREMNADADLDAVPEAPDEAITQPGDLWILGDHRLLCGDSASEADLDRLLGGEPVHLVNTDPPYNVKVEPRSNNAIAAGLSSFSATHHQGLDVARHPAKRNATHQKLRPKDRPLENDFVTDEAFDEMLRAWFGNIGRVLIPGGAFYIWGGYANCANYPSALLESDLYFSQAIIWDKQHPVLTRKDFMGAHEWCFYGWRKGAAHRFYGPANIPDLWQVKKVNPQSMVHLTEKPVELAVRAIEYSSTPGENVLDLFGGSGSTLIGCEATKRRAYLMEIDPLYCDVIVQRWEELTGRSATREPT